MKKLFIISATIFAAACLAVPASAARAPKPKPTSFSRVTLAPKKITIRWRKGVKGIKGYQIQYSTNKNFRKAKTATIRSRNIVKRVYRNLKENQRHYFRIRTYKKAGRKTYYSAWRKKSAYLKHSHNYGTWIITANPTCTQPGQMQHQCTGCGHIETMPIAQTAHNYVNHYCSVCGAWDGYVTPEIGTEQLKQYVINNGTPYTSGSGELYYTIERKVYTEGDNYYICAIDYFPEYGDLDFSLFFVDYNTDSTTLVQLYLYPGVTDYRYHYNNDLVGECEIRGSFNPATYINMGNSALTHIEIHNETGTADILHINLLESLVKLTLVEAENSLDIYRLGFDLANLGFTSFN
jgi:hypothetical protein